MHAGFFGTASFAPALQDGWMLTSLNGSSDNSSMLSAIATMMGAGSGSGGGGGGGGKAAAGAAAAAAGALAAEPPPAATADEYQRYGSNVVNGSAAPLSPDKLGALSADQVKAYITGLSNTAGATLDPAVLNGLPMATLRTLASSMGQFGASVSQARTSSQKALPWGENVLPAGLYEFVYSPVDKGAKLLGLMPVTFFCKGYAKVPSEADRQTFLNAAAGAHPEIQLPTPCKHN
jgi:hypothetical protein